MGSLGSLLPRLLLALLPDAAGWRDGKAGRPVPQPPGLRVPLPGPAPARPVFPGAGGDQAAGVGKPHRQQKAVLGPPKARAASGTGPPAAGRCSSGAARTVRTRGSRGSPPAAGWPAPPGTLAASCQPGRPRTGDALLQLRCHSRCSWRRRRGCWRPGRLAGPLGGSPRTTCFWEGSAHGPPVPASRGRLGGVRYAPLPRLLGAGCGAAGRRGGQAESAGSHREVRGEGPEQLMEAGKPTAQHSGSAPKRPLTRTWLRTLPKCLL